MRLLVHRGQALLLLVVGGLAVTAVAGAALEWGGVPVLATLRINELFAPPSSTLPAQIVIGKAMSPRPGMGPAPSADSVTAGRPSASTVAAAQPSANPAASPNPSTTVVPGAVYSWPPTDDGGGSGRGGGGGGTPGGGGSGKSGGG